MKNKAVKKGLSIILAAAMITGLTGCGGSGSEGKDSAREGNTSSNTESSADTGADNSVADDTGETRKVTYMVGQSNYIESAFTKIADKMKKEKGIEIEFQVTPDSQGTNLTQTKLASGEVPDIMQFNIPENYYIYDAAKNFITMDDQPWIERLAFDKSEITYTDGHIYGMPITGFSGVMGVIYNKEVFKENNLEVPKTYEEFLKVCETLKANGQTPIYISGNDNWTIQIAPMIFLANALDDKASEAYDKLYNNEQAFADIPEFKEALQSYQDWFTNGYTNTDYTVGTFEDSKDKVAHKEAAMIISGEYAVTDIMTKWPDAQIGMFPLPYNDVDKFLTSKYVFGEAIPKDSKNIDTALEVLNTLSQPEYLEIYLGANPLNSPYKDVESVNINSVLKEVYADYFDSNKVLPQIADMIGKFGSLNNDVFFPVYTQVAQGGDIDEAIEQFDSGLQEYGKNVGVEAFQ